MDRISDRPILSVILKSFKRSYLIGGNNGRGLKNVTCIGTIQVLLFPRDLLHCCGIVHIIEVPVKLSDFLCRKHDLYLPSKIQTLKESVLYFQGKIFSVKTRSGDAGSTTTVVCTAGGSTSLVSSLIASSGAAESEVAISSACSTANTTTTAATTSVMSATGKFQVKAHLQ